MLQPKTDPDLPYRRLFETAYDGILILDYESGSICETNPSIEKMLGYAKEELNSLQLWQIGNHIDQSKSVLAIATLKKDGTFRHSHLPLRTKAGKTITVEFNGNVYGINGKRFIQCHIRDITDRKSEEIELIQFSQSYIATMYEAINALSKVIVARDDFTHPHQLRVAHLSVAIATEMNLDHKMVEGIRLAALIHDIGKVSIPSDILNKTTALSKEDIELLRGHVQTGYDIVKNIKFQWPIAQTIYQHHCRLDGTGYPNRLKGKEIIPEARILCVADVVEAMSHSRPYRPALGIDTALQEIESGRNIRYDADAVDACLKLFRQNGYVFISP